MSEDVAPPGVVPEWDTVLVTGATGYMGKHVTLELLRRGYKVKASTRNVHRQDELKEALRPHFPDEEFLNRLSVVQLDLDSDEAWQQAMTTDGVNVLMHLASPTPVGEPEDPEQVIQPAVLGALRAVKAAQKAGVRRVIFTSSVAAVVGNVILPPGRSQYNENDWTNCEDKNNAPHHYLSAYVKSKTLAERAIWDWNQHEAPEMQITTILPAFCLGAPLDRQSQGPSVRKIGKLLSNKQPLPHYGYSCVDIRDIARLHALAIERPSQSIGRRFIGSAPDSFLWIPQMAHILAQAYPSLNICCDVASNDAIQALAEKDPSLRYVLSNLDRQRLLDNSASCHCLGMDYRHSDMHASLLETADYLMMQQQQETEKM